MARITVEDCLDQVDNRFALVLLVSKRAKQLLRGSDVTVGGRGNKYIVNALREVASGNVHFDSETIGESVIAQIERDLNRSGA